VEAASPDLYPRLLGAGWAGLPEAVRRLHGGGSRSASGLFDVRHGFSLGDGIAGWLGLPAAGQALPTVLTVTADSAGERWKRRFGTSEFVTEQRAGSDGRLLERFGPFELRLELRVEDGALRYEPGGASIRLFGKGVGIPRWLAPRVAGRVWAEGAEARVQIEVAVPLLGFVMGYSGSVRPS
jgi:Domain of unknown function (DUF4166)